MIKIIALNILDNCEDYIKKNLQSNSPYLFYKNYQLYNQDTKKHFLIKQNTNPLGSDFFSYESNNSNPSINICAIVGKNGSGKSALIDILLRIINNLAFKHLKNSTTYTNADIKWINGVKAQLYFSIDEDFFLVHQDGDNEKNINFYKLSSNSEKQQWVKLSNAKKTLGESFFYTILINYSLYAFNTNEYREEYEIPNYEESCWLKSLFHKNDGYQTPAVLNPMRTKGNIDINKENKLSKDRLISLFFNDNEIKNSNFTKINTTTEVSSLTITLDNKNVERKYQRIIDNWKEASNEKLTIDFFEKLKEFILEKWGENHKITKSNEYELASTYLVYKTISIAQTYDSQFKHSTSLLAVNGAIWNEERFQNVASFINEIDKETSHIVYKLRQTLAFLTFNHFTLKKNKLDIQIDDFALIVQNYKSEKWNYIDFVPAPFFKTEIILVDKLNNKTFKFSKLSSGERQMVYSASSILYHIRNLNSIKGNLRRVKYKNLNIILDEIELYFHPEYQRIYIDYLIKCIKSINLLSVNSINLIMSTHSPFILTDIPELNVLFLKNGDSQEGIGETFGANIHTLYKNNFFIKGLPIGEFSKNKIKSLFERVRLINEPDLKLYNEIKLVGEQLLRKQLLNLYKQNSSENLEQRVTELEKEIEKLRGK